jgi:hypothetical protein
VVEADDWDGRFGRDSLDCAPEVPIQHQVTDNQYAVTLERSFYCLKDPVEILKHAYSKFEVKIEVFDSERFAS